MESNTKQQLYSKENTMKNKNIYDTWKEFINDEKYNIYLIYNNEKIWNKYYKLLLELNDMPSQSYVTERDVKLGSWCVNQKTNKKNGKLSQELIELLEKIPNWYWDKKTCPNQSLNLQSKQGHTNRRHKVRCLTYINNTNP